ncbi:hypothetical protein BBW68_06635 [Candidatus Erwinia dacicola]|uniref:Uncharacterized protein n=1 Tax=Candidatus Erwinia dacicola TaxID=252393 RepID=A0A1E7Z2V9_9GAMM|nr:hypothetical protein BBW68_06635 [Candidatus Erwinia dacicola]
MLRQKLIPNAIEPLGTQDDRTYWLPDFASDPLFNEGTATQRAGPQRMALYQQRNLTTSRVATHALQPNGEHHV